MKAETKKKKILVLKNVHLLLADPILKPSCVPQVLEDSVSIPCPSI